MLEPRAILTDVNFFILTALNEVTINSLSNIPDVIKSLLPEYLDNREAELNLLKQLVARSDLIEIKKIGHKLAGNAGSYGLSELSTIGAKIEELETIEHMDHLLNQYESLLNEYKQCLKKER